MTSFCEMPTNKKQVVQGFLENLHRISDIKYQKRVWIEGVGPECHDFDEAVNDFFGDGDPILANYKDYGLTNNQYEALKNFRHTFEKFSNDQYFPQEFIDTPEWISITKMARDVLKGFNYE